MILLYQTATAVTNILDDMHIDYRLIDSSQLHETLGYLFSLPNFQKNNVPKSYQFDFEAMILHDVEAEVLNSMIANLKAVNANIARKAMLTKHNQHWKMGDLLHEINEEHTFFQYYDKIVYLLKESDKLHPEDYVPSTWKAYEQAFIKAYQTVQEKPDSITILKNAYQNFHATKDALQKKS